MADSYFSSVGLLLHCNGSNGSTTFTDSSPNPKTVTRFGNAQIGTAQSKFGGAAALLDGAGDYLSTPNHADLALATGDFTVEMWVRLNGTSTQILAEHYASSGFFPWRLWFDSATSKFGFRGYRSDNTPYAIQQSGTSTTGVWYHVAGVRDGSTFRLFIDGVANGTASLSGTLTAPTGVISIGITLITFAAEVNGWLDDIRITKGVARYTAAFTPPTAEFEDFGSITGYLADSGLPAAPMVMSVVPARAYISDTGPLQQPSVLAQQLVAMLLDGGLPAAPTASGWQLVAFGAAVSPLGGQELLAGFHDFRPLLDHGYPITYTMGLVTPSGVVTVPISSWQATLQTDSDCYASCVIPNCIDWLDEVYAATEFIVWRHSRTLAGEAFKHQMVRSAVDSYQIDQGPTNHTCSISSYFDAFADVADPHARYDSTLAGLRSISNYASGVRIRSSMDWLMQPGQRAYYGEASMVVNYINYYVNTSDEYIDAGHREAAA